MRYLFFFITLVLPVTVFAQATEAVDCDACRKLEEFMSLDPNQVRNADAVAGYFGNFKFSSRRDVMRMETVAVTKALGHFVPSEKEGIDLREAYFKLFNQHPLEMLAAREGLPREEQEKLSEAYQKMKDLKASCRKSQGC